ncbi:MULTISPECIES: hypothetical protein [unclassified Streptomyces]|uniref:hypothetical protein n=1 Tax=unclassified Streptomyces TaxID=2593676 RepID=UPI00332E7017
MRTASRAVAVLAGTAALAALSFGVVTAVSAGESAPRSVVSAAPDRAAPLPPSGPASPHEPDWD